MPWNGGPAGDGRSSCSRDPRRGGELPSSATFLGGRDWEKRSLETAAPWTLAGLADWSPEGTEERQAPCNAVYTALPQLTSPGPWPQDCLRSLLLEMTVLRPMSSLRLGTRVCSGRSQWDTLGRGSQAAGWPTKGTSLSRLASGVLRAASSVPWNGGRQGTADLAALETPEGVASFPAPLHFWAEETERSARWRPLRPGTLAGLADWSPEGTEERRAPCNAVCTPLFPRGACPHQSWAWHQDWLRSLLLEMTVLRPTSSLRKTRNQSLLRQIPIKHAWQGLPHRQVTY